MKKINDADKHNIEPLLKLLFNSNEHVGKMRHANFSFKQCYIDSSWSQMIINPTFSGIKEENITAYRNFLLEIDPPKKDWESTGMYDREEELNSQLQYFKESGLPISAIIYSGNKSMHILVCLENDLGDKMLWKFIRERLQNVLPKIDNNPSAVIGVRNPLNRRSDTAVQPEIKYLGERIKNQVFNEWLMAEEAKLDVKPVKKKRKSSRGFSVKRFEILVNDFGKGALRERSKSFLEGNYDEGQWHKEFWFTVNDLFGQGYTMEEVIKMVGNITGHLDSNDIYQIERIHEKQDYFNYNIPFKAKVVE